MIRSLIVWLVLLAVPFQGFAAAAALPCAPSASPIAAPAHMHHAMAAGASHQHHAMAHHGHDGPGAAGDHGGEHHAGTKCGSCPACWVGAAIASGLPTVGAQPGPSVTIPFDAGHVPSVHPSLPERPPRSARA